MKKLLLLCMVLLLVSVVPAYATGNEVIYEDTITVTSQGGRYQVGFVSVEFKKNFVKPGMGPKMIDVKVYAEDGKGYIEFTPDIPDFYKNVHIRVDSYKGLLYDKSKGQNIKMNIKKEQIIAPHFSRYCFNM